MQSTKGNGLKKRFSSWYDKNIVTREGEDILRDIDDPAIKTLRKQQLVWSGWKVFKPAFEVFSPSMPNHSIRQMEMKDAELIHRFFCSILWRASASSLTDSSEFKLSSQVEAEMKEVILGRKAPDFWSYPLSLIQLSTVGEAQNMFPMISEKTQPDGKVILFARIYIDGLIAHFHLNDPMEKTEQTENSIFLGQSIKTFVAGITYEASFQFQNLLIVAAESYGPLSWLREPQIK